jgi:hypothetical protein
MKRILTILLIAMALGLGGCNKKRIIPDDTLAKIFHDAFVVNAYIGEERVYLDSLKVYEPIFERYGYTAQDVIYTVGNFSRRKSARLGTVVEQAISRLEQESKRYASQVVILDTIRNVAVRTFTREVYADTLIKAKTRADSTKLHIEISPIHEGEYSVNYSYECKDDLLRYPRTAEFYFENKDGYRSGFASINVRSKGDINRTLVSRNEGGKLVLELGKYKTLPTVMTKGKKRKKQLPPKTQSLTIRDLKVTYKPNEESAIDSLFERYVSVKIFADGFLIKKDSLTLSADSTRISTPSAPNN